MNPHRQPRLTRAALIALTGAAFSQANAQSTLPPPVEIAPLMGMSPSRHLEIGEISAEAQETGDYESGISALSEIAIRSRDEGDRAAWLEAELELTRLQALDGKEGVEDALQLLTSRARDWDFPEQEAEIYTFWADHEEDRGRWLSALRAHDAASQAALGGGLMNRGLDALLEMSRLCRANHHPWRLQSVWVRISQLESVAVDSLDEERLLALEEERALSLPMLDETIPQKPLRPRVDLQPAASAVKVSKTHGEIGRTKLFLTNETLQTVAGSLTVKPAGGELKSWSAGESGHWLTLGPSTKGSATNTSRALSLRPGERISLFVERESPSLGNGDPVSILWDSPGQQAPADITFFSDTSLPEISITNSSSFTVRPGWPVPLYQELNYRGLEKKVAEDLQFSASVPCRLEYFDADKVNHPSVDAGELIAVDAEGDGSFTGPDDMVHPGSDHNNDGMPDMLIGERSRSLELCAWPLRELPDGEEITISARHRRTAPSLRNAKEWQTDAVNSLQE